MARILVADDEADMRRRYARDKEDDNRKSIGHVRSEAAAMRQELSALDE